MAWHGDYAALGIWINISSNLFTHWSELLQELPRLFLGELSMANYQVITSQPAL